MGTHGLPQQLCYRPGVMVVAVFSLSSLLFTRCCFVFSRCSGVASFNSAPFFAFKSVFTACGESCSAEFPHEFESSVKLSNVKTSHVTFGSSTLLIALSDVNERRLFTSLSPVLKTVLLSAYSEFKVGLNIFGSSAIVLNVPAGCSPHCIMGIDSNAAFTNPLVKVVKQATHNYDYPTS